MKSLFPFDEINAITTAIREYAAKKARPDLDEIEDLFILCYMQGTDSANEQLETSREVDSRKLKDALFREYEGKTYVDRIEEYSETNDAESIVKVIETEAHRMYNTGQFDTAEAVPKSQKKWVTMKDPRVRDTHAYLEGMTVDINDRFYTYDGDSARFPGDFEKAKNNCGCRCELELTITV